MADISRHVRIECGAERRKNERQSVDRMKSEEGTTKTSLSSPLVLPLFLSLLFLIANTHIRCVILTWSVSSATLHLSLSLVRPICSFLSIAPRGRSLTTERKPCHQETATALTGEDGKEDVDRVRHRLTNSVTIDRRNKSGPHTDEMLSCVLSCQSRHFCR